ncbi:GD11740 [Drosophila simulans]|uniref:GD11740 n=1 Tax=Drosophila simulans TaxID=7240 RepID=B4QI59_DROSI|nr:GD11740 [Drosophila simulans]
MDEHQCQSRDVEWVAVDRLNHLLDFLTVEATAESASGGRGRGRGTGSAESAAPEATGESATEAALAGVSASESAVAGVSAVATISELWSGHGLQDTEECENHNDEHDGSSHLGWLVYFRSFRFGLLIDFGLAAYYINGFAWFNNLLIWF